MSCLKCFFNKTKISVEIFFEIRFKKTKNNIKKTVNYLKIISFFMNFKKKYKLFYKFSK